jgi:hypothetical protein
VLAKAGVPLLHVCGSLDPWLESQTRLLEKRYKQCGGRITVLVDDGKGHFPTSPREVKPVVDFIVSRQTAAAGAPKRAVPLPAENQPKLVIPTGGSTPEARQETRAAPARDYRFDRTISREVLENYLSRAITMEGLLNGRGDLDDNNRMLKATGAKFIGRSPCLWTREADLLRNLERAKEQLPKVRTADPDMVLQACIFESVSTQVEQVPVPGWAFTALGQPVENGRIKMDDHCSCSSINKDMQLGVEVLIAGEWAYLHGFDRRNNGQGVLGVRKAIEWNGFAGTMIPQLHRRSRRFILTIPRQVNELFRFRIEGSELVKKLAAAETNLVGDELLAVLAGDSVDIPCRSE